MRTKQRSSSTRGRWVGCEIEMTEYLVVKDFEKFQHYKDREPPWIKLHRSILRNYEFLQLPETAQLHLIKIWLLASQIGNKIPNDDDFIAREIGADKYELIQNKLLIIRAGFLVKLKKTGPKPRKQKEKSASAKLADCKQNAMPETEAEAEAEKRKNIQKEKAQDGTSDVKPDRARRTQIPEQWAPGRDGVDYARKCGLPESVVKVEVERFVNHHRSKGNTFADHSRAWQTWCRNWEKFNQVVNDEPPRTPPTDGYASILS